MSYSLMINRPYQDVLSYLNTLDGSLLPADGGFSFEAVRGGTRIVVTSPEGPRGFFKLADWLIRQITRQDDGPDVPDIMFEP